MAAESTRKTGREKEELAEEYLCQQGYKILEKNFFGHFGEIDIIAREGDTLVFAEVKYRKSEKLGNPLEAVDLRKQRKICKTALYYIAKHRVSNDIPCRFDVIGIVGDDITHIKNAFEFRE
ncbi:MAG: YraN family protein [Roseburia sp.]|nr:YraN family protein [Roseburia sp.]